MAIRITSKLTATEQRRINRAADRTAETDSYFPSAFVHHPSANATYIAASWPADGHDHQHDVARHMMTVAGRTFDYELV